MFIGLLVCHSRKDDAEDRAHDSWYAMKIVNSTRVMQLELLQEGLIQGRGES